jgi:hypothetical protein
MRFGLGFAYLALTASLAACSGEKSGALAPLKVTPAQVEAHVTKLAGETFKAKAEGAADIAAVRDALPAAVKLSWGALNFDAASGATVLTDVKLTPADTPTIGVGIAEVRLWEFDAAFAKARLGGQRLTETAKLARRIEAKGVSLFGLETVMGSALDTYTGAVAGVVEQQAGPDAAAQVQSELAFKLDKYDVSIARIILDDVMLRPFELTLVQLPADNEFAEVMPILQSVVAVSRSFAADTVASLDMKAQMSGSQGGQPMSLDMTMASYGIRGMRGSDTDAGYFRGFTFLGNIAPPDAPGPIAIGSAVDLITIEGIRLDKAMGYLTRGEWPARTETDLLSAGKVVTKNQTFSMNGANLYSVGESVVEATGWHWWIPTKLRFTASDLVYDIKGFSDFMKTVAPAPIADPDAPPPPPMDIPPEVMALLTKYGLDKPSLDYTLGWNWNATSGATVIDSAFGLDNYLRFDLKYDGGLPDFKSVSDLVPDDPSKADQAAIQKVFEAKSTLKLAEFNVADEGGLAKIYGLVAEGAKLMPDDPTGGMFANQTPESIRTLASNGTYMLAEQAGQMVPKLKELIAPYGAFLAKGGKVKTTLKPKTPLAIVSTMTAVEKGELSPEQLVEQLNATTVHTPPPAK